MIHDKKVIGICLTRIHDTTISNYIDRLHSLARKQGYKLLVFNSFVDFYHEDAFDEGAKAVYEIINFEKIDVLLIYAESFCKQSIVEEIAQKAKQNQVPVILLNHQLEGCFSIVKEYETAFRAILSHVIKDHGAKNTFFMAGLQEKDPISQGRLEIYKEVLAENGIAFDETKVGYGEYWEEPTKKTMESLLIAGEKLPEAIICANDSMAIAVCDMLNRCGYKVPRDVLVTGFDGVPAAKYHSPQITTCNENLTGLAEKTMNLIRMIVEEKLPCCVVEHEYKTSIAESCGCQPMVNDGFRIDAEYLFNALNNMEVHEENMYTWIDRMLGINDMNSLFENLAGCIIEDSYVCLNNDYVGYALQNNELEKSKLSDEFLVIHSRYEKTDSDKTEVIELKQMIPDSQEWVKDDTLYVLSAVYAGDEVCGYYAVKTDNIMSCRHKIKRVAKTLNVACNVSLNYFRQMRLRLSIENANVMNHITGLPNLKGTVEWFKDFAEIEANHQKSLSISVYGLPKYTYIYENYGIKDAEEAVRFVAESLKLANPVNCFIGHIAEDEFVIINYYDDAHMITETINSATSVFFSVVEGYNTNSNKDYYVEVNCGCTEIEPDWRGSIEGYIKAANSEMYMNRLKMGAGVVVKEKVVPKEQYKALELLLQKNLFFYHFQPIVSAKNGEIYGYEALMRTEVSIGMSPLEVLDAAREYSCLYEIEKATMFNILERYSKDKDKFGEKKIFINTIPGYFLNDEDIAKINDKYGELLSNVVFELTEQNAVPDEELAAIRKMKGGNEESQIAIDDYGAGHSNIVNLMRYAPQLIKVDRYLISDIHKDLNKQMFVRSTIEFAKMNQIKVLAEGVETSNELRMVIDLGVDLIQGYYTGRPVAEPIANIDDEIRQEILKANPLITSNGE